MDAYHIALAILIFILGISIGSFVNVLIFRLRSGVGVSGRSRCMACSKTLHAGMLIPLFSFLYQRGRCAFCRVRLSLQYPLVEVLLGILYVTILLVRGFDPLQASFSDILLMLTDMFVWTTLLAITVYDIRHKIIPDSFSLLLAVCGGFALFLRYKFGLLHNYSLAFLESGSIPAWIDFFAGPFLALPFALLWLLSRGRAMGLGDAKIAWGIGWFLGLPYGISAIVLSFWIAFFPSLLLLLLPKKRFTMKSEIPFAPFLVLGTFVVYAWGINILNWTF